MQREGEIRFSIIVPVYNVENYLAACVKSVVEQPGAPDWECILIDDGSTDRSKAICDALAASCPGVIALHRENGGLAAARNTGLSAAKGDWILFLDSDDRMAPRCLEGLRRALAEYPGFDWYVGRFLEFYEETGACQPHAAIDAAFVPGPFESGDYAERVARLYASGHWSVWKYCLRRAFLADNAFGFWPSVRWAEDWPFTLLLLTRCTRLCFVDVECTLYRVARAGSLLTDARNLPRRFDGIHAALRRFGKLHQDGQLSDAEYTEILHRAADVFWPQARTAAAKDASVRRACIPGIAALRELYPYGREVNERRGWRLFRRLLQLTGPRFALFAGAFFR